MVATPWGNSDSLRERRLRPGPGTPREEVAANQRARLFGAMVASVADRGYLATSVNDLVELSGVSSRSFYDLFADKQACFLATMEAIIEAAIAFTAQSAGEAIGEPQPGGVRLPAVDELTGRGWEERARIGFDAFATMVASQPAAARLVLVESFAAGSDVLVPLREAVAGFESLVADLLEQSPERAGMPPELVIAIVGAAQEIARTRLREGHEAELGAAIEELWQLLVTYRPPPEPLRLLGRPPKAGPEPIDAHEHAERALRAFAAVAAEQGYAETTVEAVLRRAQMSATTFYSHFHGKEDAMLAAIDSFGAQIIAAVLPAVRRSPGWGEGIRAGVGALCNFLASRPSLARLMMVEVYAAGPAAIERRAEVLAPLAAQLEPGAELSPSTPALAAEAIGGAAYTLIYRRIEEAGPEALPALAPILTYLALDPFLGPAEAARLANSEVRARRPAAGRQPPA
ncbi:MAG TPA: TetR/AcrR family transcriptional regulator [Solirubrobacterales bacterium]|nr:TetR/AcrR family transcriptional regulator [Solirubrobacterales bacterium]